MTSVYIAGQGGFAATVAKEVSQFGHKVTGVCSPAYAAPHAGEPATPLGDAEYRHDRLRTWAWANAVAWTDTTVLRAEAVPSGTEVILAAHSHAFIGRRTRAAAHVAIGYHPSLLPLHRGRDAVRWTIRDGDRVCGGTVYHLTDNVDAGPIAAQDYALVPPGATAAGLWRDTLAPMGVRLILKVLSDIERGVVAMIPQDESLATWEPSMDSQRLHRPELPELTSGLPTPIRFTAEPL